jgi:hypothetical protein
VRVGGVKVHERWIDRSLIERVYRFGLSNGMQDFRAESKFETHAEPARLLRSYKIGTDTSVQAHISPGDAICTVLK